MDGGSWCLFFLFEKFNEQVAWQIFNSSHVGDLAALTWNGLIKIFQLRFLWIGLKWLFKSEAQGLLNYSNMTCLVHSVFIQDVVLSRPCSPDITSVICCRQKVSDDWWPGRGAVRHQQQYICWARGTTPPLLYFCLIVETTLTQLKLAPSCCHTSSDGGMQVLNFTTTL